MAAADEAELVHMVATAAAHDAGPIAFRFPRGDGVGVEMPARGVPLEIGRGRVVREGSRVALLPFGTRLSEVLKAAEVLAARGISPTVADARFAKPLDRALILGLARGHERGADRGAGAGGFGRGGGGGERVECRYRIFSLSCCPYSSCLPKEQPTFPTASQL